MQQNVIQIIYGITINVDVNVKNIYVKMIWNPATCHCENGKYLATKTIPTNFNEKKHNL